MDSLVYDSDMKIILIPRLWAYKGESLMFRKDDIARWKMAQKKLKRNVLKHMLKVRRLHHYQEKCFAHAGKLSTLDDAVKMVVSSLPDYRGSEQMKSQMKRIRHLRAEQLHLRSKLENKMHKLNTLLAAEKKLRCKIEMLSSCLQVEVEDVLRRQAATGFRKMAETDLANLKPGAIEQHARTLYEMTGKGYLFYSFPDTVTDYKVQKRIEKSFMMMSLWNKRCAIPVNDRVCLLSEAESQLTSKDTDKTLKPKE